jgi:predicted dithiol-disulfide oxidoreductase (DUF899 family)
MPKHEVVTREAWLGARTALLKKEKELTRLHDRLCEERRALPWVRVEKAYEFDTPGGTRTLAELFDGRSQLFVQHFMFGPDWEEGCPGCSFMADHVDGANVHLAHHDVTFTAVSRAPLAKIEAFKKRMGWRFPWVSSRASDFNHDYHVSFTPEQLASGPVMYNFAERAGAWEEMPGLSVFALEGGEVFHTYSSYGRGVERMMGAYGFLDITPKGRNETRGWMDWVRHHDRYEGPARAGGRHS